MPVREWILKVAVVTGHDLDTREMRRELERLFSGYTSKITFPELLDVEVVDAEANKKRTYAF